MFSFQSKGFQKFKVWSFGDSLLGACSCYLYYEITSIVLTPLHINLLMYYLQILGRLKYVQSTFYLHVLHIFTVEFDSEVLDMERKMIK